MQGKLHVQTAGLVCITRTTKNVNWEKRVFHDPLHTLMGILVYGHPSGLLCLFASASTYCMTPKVTARPLLCVYTTGGFLWCLASSVWNVSKFLSLEVLHSSWQNTHITSGILEDFVIVEELVRFFPFLSLKMLVTSSCLNPVITVYYKVWSETKFDYRQRMKSGFRAISIRSSDYRRNGLKVSF